MDGGGEKIPKKIFIKIPQNGDTCARCVIGCPSHPMHKFCVFFLVNQKKLITGLGAGDSPAGKKKCLVVECKNHETSRWRAANDHLLRQNLNRRLGWTLIGQQFTRPCSACRNEHKLINKVTVGPLTKARSARNESVTK